MVDPAEPDAKPLPPWLDLPWLSSAQLLPVAALAAVAIVLTACAVFPISRACIALTLMIGAVAVILSLIEPVGERAAFLNLFALAASVNGLALLILTGVSRHGGGPFLGPDSAQFVYGATDLAQKGFRLPIAVPMYFGTYNVSQFYLFASAIRFLHADLYTLQTLNVGLIALVAPLTLAVARSVVRPYARLTALIVALHPSLIGLSAVDVLKDPSIMVATMCAIWAVMAVVETERLRTSLSIALVAMFPLVYLRTGRFFVFTYLEIGACAAGLWLLVRGGRRPSPRSLAKAGLLTLAFLSAEMLPMRAGWPPSQRIFTLEATLTASARLEGLPSPAENETPAVSVAADHVSQRWGVVPGRAVKIVLNVGRRFFGPFPWIVPTHFDFRYLQFHGVLMYPGVLGWYALMPVLAVGWLFATLSLLKSRTPSFSCSWLWLFGAVYLAPYVLLDFNYLPYRQRDAALPILLTVAFAGNQRAGRTLDPRRWYVVFGIALLAVVVSHLALRAKLAG
jgi:hypothetical protein